MIESSPDYGYEELPPDGRGVIRIRTHYQLRVWHIPRQGLKVLEGDLGQLRFPGLYILLDTVHHQVYVGESDNLRERLETHNTAAPKELPNWNLALAITDGRPIALSDLSDPAIRRRLETHLIDLFSKSDKFSAVNKQARAIEPSIWQTGRFDQVRRELVFVLQKRQVLPLVAPTVVSEDFIELETFRDMLASKGFAVGSWSSYEAEVNGKPAFIRDGSKKPRGWQITLRNTFRRSVRQENEGLILMNRGPGLAIPFEAVRELLKAAAPKKDMLETQNTVDIFVKFHPDNRVTLHYKGEQIDISEHKLS